jgi:hypothetical protein
LLIASLKWRRLRRGVVWLTAGAAALSSVGLLLKLIGVTGQANGPMISLALPLNLATAAVALLLTRPVKRIEVSP